MRHWTGRRQPRRPCIPRDRSKIVIDSENQVRIWTRHFGVTQQELARAIERVGNSAATVRKQLATSKVASRSKEKIAATKSHDLA
jgi:DNA polymerase III sliding clamp (beta) subunit (PCNA family)